MSPSKKSLPDNDKQEPKLGFFEAAWQGLALLFAIQNKKGRERLMGLAETNPLPVLFSGFMASAIFFSFCFITSQLMIHFLTK